MTRRRAGIREPATAPRSAQRLTSPPLPAASNPLHGLSTPEALLQFQRTAGNAAGQRLLATTTSRGGGLGLRTSRLLAQRDPTPTATAYKSWDEIADLSFGDLDRYASQQADWHASPHMDDAQVACIRSILAFVREPNILDACRAVKVRGFNDDLTSRGADAVCRHVRLYSKTVVDQDPIDVPVAENAVQANDFGEHLTKVRGRIPDPVLRTAVRWNAFRPLVIANCTDALINYHTTVNPTPIFQAQNGADVFSFVLMHNTDGKDPVSYAQAPLTGRVRNFHRFEVAALEQLTLNYGNTAKKKPLTLILHSALDHNGAFHRDPEITAMITSADILTLMIEGKETLDDVEADIPGLAQAYGVNNKIDQVMIAGHGESRIVELAGSTVTGEDERPGSQHFGQQVLKEQGEPIDISSPEGQQRAKKLLNKVLEHMDKKDGPFAALGRWVARSPAAVLQPHRRSS